MRHQKEKIRARSQEKRSPPRQRLFFSSRFHFFAARAARGTMMRRSTRHASAAASASGSQTGEPATSPSELFASPELQVALLPMLHSLDHCRLSLTCTNLRSILNTPEFAARVVTDVGPVKELLARARAIITGEESSPDVWHGSRQPMATTLGGANPLNGEAKTVSTIVGRAGSSTCWRATSTISSNATYGTRTRTEVIAKVQMTLTGKGGILPLSSLVARVGAVAKVGLVARAVARAAAAAAAAIRHARVPALSLGSPPWRPNRRSRGSGMCRRRCLATTSATSRARCAPTSASRGCIACDMASTECCHKSSTRAASMKRE